MIYQRQRRTRTVPATACALGLVLCVAVVFAESADAVQPPATGYTFGRTAQHRYDEGVFANTAGDTLFPSTLSTDNTRNFGGHDGVQFAGFQQSSDAVAPESPFSATLDSTSALESSGNSTRFLNQTDDRFPTLRWSGFLQIETGDINQDEANVATVGDINASSGLRRVRLRADGNIQESTSYVIDLDFAASGHPSFRNVGLTFHEVPVVQNVQAGLLKTPFGMDAMTSGQELLFLERQLPFALVPFRQLLIGVTGNSLEDRVSWGLAGYRMPTNSFGVYEGGAGGIAVAGRLTGVPIYEQDGAFVLHFGAGYSLGSPGGDSVRYAIQPGFFTRDPGTIGGNPGTVPVFLDTGDIAANLFNLFNLELGMNAGPFHLASEVRWSVVDQIGGPELTFPGVYVQCSYVLTGEHHRYSRERGVFQRVIPKNPLEHGSGRAHGTGAVEAALGWSFLDLTEENISGGSGNMFDIGLNWYLTPNAKLQFNVVPISMDKSGFGESSAVTTAIRAQVEF